MLGYVLSQEDILALRPGDLCHVRNWEVSEEGKEEAMQGENVIIAGYNENWDLMVFGHPWGELTVGEVSDSLNDYRIEGAHESASLATLRWRVNYDKVMKLRG